MAIKQEILDKFMDKIYMEPPNCKGVAPDDLKAMIRKCTGLEYEEHTPLRPHQLEGLAFALYMQKSMLFFWMRLGKSLTALEWSRHLRRANFVEKKGLIVAHSPVGVDVWEGQVKQHAPGMNVKTIRSKAAHPKHIPSEDQLFDALESDCDLIVISQHMLTTLFVEKKMGRNNRMKEYPDMGKLRIFAGFFDHCVIDETHFYSAQYGLPFLTIQAAVAECVFRLGLTGTPVGRDPFKIWSQACLIDEGTHFGSIYPFFEQAFGRKVYKHFMPTKEGWEFDKSTMPVFQYKLNCFSMSYGKGEVKSAEVYEGVINLEMNDEQKKYYNDVLNKMIKTRFDDRVEIEGLFSKLRMIGSGHLPYNDADGEKQTLHFPSVKLEWLAEFVKEVPAGTQCLIFHEYVHTGELICKVLKDNAKTYRWLHGNARDKPGQIAQFNAGDAQFMVANHATGGTAIDLPTVDYVCFFESPCSPIQRAQAAARPMNRGDRLLTLDDLVCSPVEARIRQYIKEGDDLLRTVLAGGKARLADLFVK